MGVVSFAAALRLAAEVTLAIVGFEEGPDDAVGVEGDEGTRLPVEACGNTVAPDDFDDRAAHLGVAQQLRLPQIVLLGDAAEFAAVLFEVLFEPARVGRPSISNRFFTANGTPISGP